MAVESEAGEAALGEVEFRCRSGCNGGWVVVVHTVAGRTVEFHEVLFALADLFRGRQWGPRGGRRGFQIHGQSSRFGFGQIHVWHPSRRANLQWIMQKVSQGMRLVFAW